MKTKSKRTSGLEPKRLKRLPRRAFQAEADATEARNTKVRISILIDPDVLNFFKDRASMSGAAAYQTQINSVLRAQMEGKEAVDTKSLAQDDRFIREVARRVKELSTKAFERLSLSPRFPPSLLP